jgi:predicted nucleic acid-binding protein
VGGRSRDDAASAGRELDLIAFVDTNVLIRHLTGAPPEQAQRATEALRAAGALFVTDVVFAECLFVLESFYELPRERVAATMRALLALPASRFVDAEILLRALEVYEVQRLDFAEAHLVASAERTGVGAVMSFDRDLWRAPSVRWLEP